MDRLGRSDWEKDELSFAEMKDRASSNNYVAAGVIQANNTLGEYLQNILNSFWGSFRFNEDGALEVFLKSFVETSRSFETVNEHDAITLEVAKDLSQIINSITIHYAVSYSGIDRRYEDGGEASYFRTVSETTGDATQSIRRYGTCATTLSFDWNRNTASVETLQEAFLDAFNEPQFIVTYTGQDCKFVPLEVGDQVTATLSLVRDSDNVMTEDVVYEIREIATNFDTYETELVLYSLNFLDLKDLIGGIYIGSDPVYIGSGNRAYIIGLT
jgi:hypothetical protein